MLQRRGLFDFISPIPVILGLLRYPPFVVLALYVGRHAAFVIGVVTAIYCFVGFLVHVFIHGGKNNPLQSHAEHMHVIGANVRIMIYSCLVAVLSVMTNLMLVVIDRQNLMPFAVNCTFVAVAAWMYSNMKGLPAASPPNGFSTGAAH